MNEQNKLRHLAKCIRDDADKRATELEQIADDLDRKHRKPGRRNPREIAVKCAFVGFSTRDIHEILQKEGFNVTVRTVQRWIKEPSERSPDVSEPALFGAAPTPAPAPFVPFDDRPEVRTVVAKLTETVASSIGSIAQALVDDDRERQERFDDARRRTGLDRLDN